MKILVIAIILLHSGSSKTLSGLMDSKLITIEETRTSLNWKTSAVYSPVKRSFFNTSTIDTNTSVKFSKKSNDPVGSVQAETIAVDNVIRLAYSTTTTAYPETTTTTSSGTTTTAYPETTTITSYPETTTTTSYPETTTTTVYPETTTTTTAYPGTTTTSYPGTTTTTTSYPETTTTTVYPETTTTSTAYPGTTTTTAYPGTTTTAYPDTTTTAYPGTTTTAYPDTTTTYPGTTTAYPGTTVTIFTTGYTTSRYSTTYYPTRIPSHPPTTIEYPFLVSNVLQAFSSYVFLGVMACFLSTGALILFFVTHKEQQRKTIVDLNMKFSGTGTSKV